MSQMTDTEAIGAIRLAVTGAADSDAAVRVIQAILDEVPPSPPGDTESVRCFLAAVSRADCTVEVAR